jgi:ankyrin repeat protein
MARSLTDILQSTADVLFPEEIEGAHVELSSRAGDGDTPLHVMTWREDVEGVHVLLEASADPNVVGDMSETPLHIACRKANKPIVELLLRAGARADLRSEFNETPYEIAQQNPDIAPLCGRGR